MHRPGKVGKPCGRTSQAARRNKTIKLRYSRPCSSCWLHDSINTAYAFRKRSRPHVTALPGHSVEVCRTRSATLAIQCGQACMCDCRYVGNMLDCSVKVFSLGRGALIPPRGSCRLQSVQQPQRQLGARNPLFHHPAGSRKKCVQAQVTHSSWVLRAPQGPWWKRPSRPGRRGWRPLPASALPDASPAPHHLSARPRHNVKT